jgi:endonuclease/exonuclease/phosphatase family metal-dependent hydrolase
MRTLITYLIYFIINALFIGGVYGCQTNSEEPQSEIDNNNNSEYSLKIVCYNIRYGELASLEELAEFIKNSNADIVALQEVDVKTNRKNAPHQNGKDFITELGYHSGLLTAYARTINYSDGYYGIGILSKFPFKLTKKILLPHSVGALEQRALIMADVELPGDKIITFVSTHLDHSNSEVRKIQVQALNEALEENPHPIIIAGDFNAKPDSPEINEGMKKWGQACTNELTAPANSPRSKIDYIFYYPLDKWKVLNAETPKIQLSDHLPVIAEIELQN